MIQGIHRRLPIEITDALRKRFWPRVQKNGPNECWPWTAAMRNSYGAIKHKGRVLSAHRVAYALEHGDPPADQLVRHKCDNRVCCNPAHLELGSPKDNIDDMRRIHVFRPRGEEIEGAVLNNELVARIWEIRKEKGYGKRKIASMLGIAPTTIGSVLQGKTWRHLTPEWALNSTPTK